MIGLGIHFLLLRKGVYFYLTLECEIMGPCSIIHVNASDIYIYQSISAKNLQTLSRSDT